MALWLNCILQPAEHLGPAFYSRFHCRPTQLPPSPTCKFFSFPASHTGRWERQEWAYLVSNSPLFDVKKGSTVIFKLDPTCLRLTKLTAKRTKIRRQCLRNVQCILAAHTSLQLACLLLLFNRFFWRQWIFLLRFCFLGSDLSNFSVSAISGLSDMVAEGVEQAPSD